MREAAVKAPLSGVLAAHERCCKSVGFGKSFSGLRVRSFAAIEEGDLYQFGVANGNTLIELVNTYNRTTWGFDSFVGLPAEQTGESTLREWAVGMKRGNRGAGAAAVHNHVIRQLRGRFPADRLTLIPGFYNESLTRGLARELGMRPAVYVDIDADLYVSTLHALDWLFAERLLVPGSVVGYDDWCAAGSPCTAPPRDGCYLHTHCT